jgi:hypothetical protein
MWLTQVKAGGQHRKESERYWMEGWGWESSGSALANVIIMKMGYVWTKWATSSFSQQVWLVSLFGA